MNARKFCAHRGVSAHMPENTLPAFAAALALGADEIEFDIRLTKDDQMIVSHDDTLERISDGCGRLQDFTLEELKKLNIGGKHGWFVSFCTPEEVFSQFANRIVFNMHVKEHGKDGLLIRKIADLVKQYHAQDSVYFAASPTELAWMQKIAPEIERTAIQLPQDEIDILDMAKQYECTRVQFWNDMFDRSLIDKLHESGVKCNHFYADTQEDYQHYFEMGVDTLLTNKMDLAAQYKKNSSFFR